MPACMQAALQRGSLTDNAMDYVYNILVQVVSTWLPPFCAEANVNVGSASMMV